MQKLKKKLRKNPKIKYGSLMGNRVELYGFEKLRNFGENLCIFLVFLTKTLSTLCSRVNAHFLAHLKEVSQLNVLQVFRELA